jgi:hypothetical protein
MKGKVVYDEYCMFVAHVVVLSSGHSSVAGLPRPQRGQTNLAGHRQTCLWSVATEQRRARRLDLANTKEGGPLCFENQPGQPVSTRTRPRLLALIRVRIRIFLASCNLDIGELFDIFGVTIKFKSGNCRFTRKHPFDHYRIRGSGHFADPEIRSRCVICRSRNRIQIFMEAAPSAWLQRPTPPKRVCA